MATCLPAGGSPDADSHAEAYGAEDRELDCDRRFYTCCDIIENELYFMVFSNDLSKFPPECSRPSCKRTCNWPDVKNAQ